jgi:CubicO group peptidase (beta-lactamase class C family)
MGWQTNSIPEWIAESTSEHSRCIQWGNLAYGYLWWIIDGDSYAAMGDGGNVIYVNTKKKMVIPLLHFSYRKPGIESNSSKVYRTSL